jgi:beta-galactosidase
MISDNPAPASALMQLGVCYYPEHWPEALWQTDARQMREAGLSRVRIGEFAWSRIEPHPGQFDWSWLDRAIETLHAEGLGIILCTPTATPPKWLVDSMPDMIAIDREGRPRNFGSRRHYCFSHAGYRQQAARITRAMAERYGAHPAVAAWQTDNEYGCHDTVLSFSTAALQSFRIWLADHYGSIEALNTAWGNVFWAQEYRSFAEVGLPNLTVTEANPAQWLAFRRFASDEVVSFNKAQVDILRRFSPGRDIVHNFMGFFTEFDHHDVARDLDAVGWDNYPLGFLDSFRFSEADKHFYARQGHPDIAAFHHDLYRGCANKGRWWVLEQQPGPVNWARHNPAPLPGMVRLWTLEALAHGAELVSYFRWRQLPFGQEQLHAGLLRPDSAPAPALAEVAQAAQDIITLGPAAPAQQSVALIFAYYAEWVTGIQPQGAGLSALWAAFDVYSALRELGLDIDILAPDASLAGYAMCVIPCLPIMPETLLQSLASFSGQIIIGPRSGSRTPDFAIPEGLPPGPIFPAKVVRVESLRPGLVHPADGWEISRWLEHLETDAEVEMVANDGMVASWKSMNRRYLGAWPNPELLKPLLQTAAIESGLATFDLPIGLRVRRTSTHVFAFNYSSEAVVLPDGLGGELLLGSRNLGPADLAVLAL